MANLIEIGKSGIKVPFLGMGTWAIGGGSWWGDNDDELSVKTIQRAIDLGIKWIDTAPIYGLYHSEDRKSKFKVITDGHETPVFQKKSGTKVYRAFKEISTLTLGTDYIDVLYTHCFIRSKRQWMH